MRIERSICLAVVAFLGATGCEVHLGDQPPPATPQQTMVASTAPTPATTADPSVPPQAQAASPPPAPAPQPTRVVPLRLHGNTPAPEANAVASAPSCLDSGVASTGNCSAMQPLDPTCAPSKASQVRCAAYRAYFTPKVGAAAVSCMVALSSKQACDDSQTDNCGKSALAQACPDSSVAQLCSVAAGSCKSTAAECTALLSGLNDQGKQLVAQCVARGCAAGLYGCVQGLASSGPSTSKLR